MDSRGFSLSRAGYIENTDFFSSCPFPNARRVSPLNQVYHEIGLVKPPGQFQGEQRSACEPAPGKDERSVRVLNVQLRSDAVIWGRGFLHWVPVGNPAIFR